MFFVSIYFMHALQESLALFPCNFIKSQDKLKNKNESDL